jgi:hypothetical protein
VSFRFIFIKESAMASSTSSQAVKTKQLKQLLRWFEDNDIWYDK